MQYMGSSDAMAPGYMTETGQFLPTGQTIIADETLITPAEGPEGPETAPEKPEAALAGPVGLGALALILGLVFMSTRG